jgi:hypothetical protein
MSKEEQMTEEAKQFKLSIPLEIKRWLAVEAARNLRSQSAEIVIALREKMERSENEKSGTSA